ncbi:nucleotidyltransferase domain-containing protein [Longimicrobium sp.]|uniref:nucleotidyltransferase domain-containing protein n=1 Tax=Longimicrobium sp. TaxID=2029185 RepID=UPI003B3BD90C
MSVATESAQVYAIAPDDDGRIAFPPAMEARFRPALAAVYDEMLARQDAIALLCFGSAPRGEAKPNSDLDVFAVIHGTEYWRQSRMINGVEVQLQVGPLQFWRVQIEKGHPVLIDAFATGELLFDRTGEATVLKRDAEERYHRGPREPAPEYFERQRYMITNSVRDLEDMSEDSVEARMLAGVMVLEALNFWGANQLIWPHRKPSVMLRRLQGRDPSLAAKIESFYASSSPAHAIAFTDAVLEQAGGRLYVFSTDPEPV